MHKAVFLAQPSMMAQHPWEADAGPLAAGPAAAHPWEGDAVDADPLSDDSDAEATRPADELVQYLVDLLLNRTINAKHYCNIMRLVANAGVHEVREHGFRDDAPSGHYSRHLNTVLGFDADSTRLYTMSVPGRSRRQAGRTEHKFFVVPPHEQLFEEMADDAAVGKLTDAVVNRELAPCYFEHPIVQAHHGDLTLPFCIFIDGVPYSQTDSVIGFWTQNVITNRRHLFAAVRKRHVCNCGCRGWCTLFPIYQMIAWSLRALAAGEYPATRHDGEPFAPSSDVQRISTSGNKARVRGMLLFVKGDWAELGSTVGLPIWNDSMRPCYSCNVSLAGLSTVAGVSLLEVPWRPNKEEDYFDACTRCEIRVVITAANHVEVSALLMFDKRDGGSKGLALTRPYPALGLAAGDRVEPSKELPDVGLFLNLDTFPMVVTFWRPSLETLSRHRNPLFDIEIGATPYRCLTEDTLHCLYLGTMHAYTRHAVWSLLSSGIWGRVGTRDEELLVAVECFKHELHLWYKARRRSHPDEVLTQVSDVTMKMVGSPTDRKLKTKGAETYGILLYVLDLMQRKMPQLGGVFPMLLEAGRCMERVIVILGQHGVHVPMNAVQELLDAYKRHCVLTDGIPSLKIPKRHQCVHMLLKIPLFGNPRFYANWTDETNNKLLKRATRETSQASFEQCLLLRMPRVLDSFARKRKAEL